MPPGPAHSQPQCAVCTRAITKSDEFVISGTEVFHLFCVKAYGVHRSVGHRRKQLVVELQGKHDAAQNELARFTHDFDKRLERIVKLEAEVIRLQREALEATNLKDSYKSQRDAYRQQRDEARAERDIAQRRQAELLTENDLLRAVGNRVPASATPADPPAAKTLEEAQAERFSLLELD